MILRKTIEEYERNLAELEALSSAAASCARYWETTLRMADAALVKSPRVREFLQMQLAQSHCHVSYFESERADVEDKIWRMKNA